MSNKKFKILTISGGGIRGIIPATILQELEIEVGKPAHEMFDLIVGTSTGGIVASCVASNIPAEMVASLYIEKASEIFHRSFAHKVKSGFGILGSKYTNKALFNNVSNLLGEKLISKASVDFMATAYETTTNSIKLFKSWKKEDFYYTFTDVSMATSAAPTTFPSYKGFIDGGIYANSPVEVAWIEGLKKGYKPEDIVIVSLGTGSQPHKSYSTQNWGIKSWLKKDSETPLLNMVFNGIQEKDHYITNLMFSNFIHHNPIIDSKIKPDETDKRILHTLYNVGKNSFKSLEFQNFLIKHIYY